MTAIVLISFSHRAFGNQKQTEGQRIQRRPMDKLLYVNGVDENYFTNSKQIHIAYMGTHVTDEN